METTPIQNDLVYTPKTPLSEPLNSRAKTSLRLRYESEARVLLRELGGLEGIRYGLGLSQRKICQLLLVDPSAWSRWVKDESKIPPHVVKALQWYLALEEKDPSWARWREMILKKEPDPELDRFKRQLEQKISDIQNLRFDHRTGDFSANFDSLKTQLSQLELENRGLQLQIARQQSLGLGWKVFLWINLGLGAFLLWKLIAT